MPFPSLPPSLFPTYLVPSLPFRRRKSSTDSNASTSSSVSTDSNNGAPTAAAPAPQTYLTGNTSHLRCNRCLADLASAAQVVSKGFTGRHGRAYLVSASEKWTLNASPTGRKDTLPNLPNTFTHKPVPRQLVTGAHTVSDISCAQCGSVLGWKYVAAEEESQHYKVGKFILETKRVCRSSGWEGEDAVLEAGGVPSNKGRRDGIEEVEFDSQDEDECEDLFMGVWTPQAAAKRRKMKSFAKGKE